MKKKILVILLALIIAVLPLAGCSGDSYSSIPVVGQQDTSYAVHSNGGNAVQYGNYIYFINGTAGYTDENGTANVWNKVVKGALYRAELLGSKNGAEFNIAGEYSAVTGDYLEFTYTQGKDYDENDIDVINTQLIAPKVIGTSGYANGGIYIFDDYVYYASPNNERNKAGTVQFSKTDFFRTSLDGRTTQKLFTSAEDTADKPYAFYKQNGKVYLVVLDGTTLKSIVIGSRKVEDVLQIAENVTAAYLPVKSDYTPDMNTNGVEDFVYISRAVESTDMQKSGSILEFMRPDGSERTIFLSNGETSSIESVRDGLVFYRTVYNKTNTVIAYTNLHDFFMGENEDDDGVAKVNSPTYKAYEDSLAASDKRTHVYGVALNVTNLADYTYTYAFRPNAAQDKNSNVVYVLAATASEVRLFSTIGRSQVIYSGAATIALVDGNYAYFSDGAEDNQTYRINIFETNESAEKVSERTVITSGLPVDVCAGYVVYFGKIDDYASGYALFNKLPGKGIAGTDAVFVGVRSEEDIPDEDDLKKDDDEESGDSSST